MITESISIEEQISFDPESPLYECRAVLVEEEVGGFSVYAARLPGVYSEGETEAEAIENIAEAFRDAIESYHELGMAIPWTEAPPIDNGKEVWILVHG